MTRQVAVVGGGWSGLAAALEAAALGAQVTLFDMAPRLGGRARSLGDGPEALDNGQHILIGAYTSCLALMRRVGVDPVQALLRTPLRLRYPDRDTLTLPGGPPWLAFTRGVLGCSAWSWPDRLRFLMVSSRWMATGFRCRPSLSVAALCGDLPDAIRRDLIEPLCVAALNTPAPQASAQVFLRVLKDALFSGPGSADLLLPRAGLSALLPEPARAALLRHGAQIRTARVQALRQAGDRWQIEAGDDAWTGDAVVLATTSVEAARLTRDLAPAWSTQTAAFEFQPIITVYLESEGSALPAPMVALRETAEAPAQFAFDLGQLAQRPGLFSFVISGAAPWVERGLDATAEATLAQAIQTLPWRTPPRIHRVLSEKRATFACTPGLLRPSAALLPGLVAAGDYLAGPYPATLEGAVRSGLAAAHSVMRHNSPATGH
ncbi:squalene-associated FAD-dependent desaturase [Roseateles sp. YR242]|uniref:hydroxysqualene dehydroxylase HpnE n=1 Tax=Roseateles sp. YR242 TaxID=1855305 RepID=UPI0008CA4A61|nr:hydroxysqualene dehydroxylase HpnE [Roseateles sp. YR242]SEL02095.1 squalene-associated FAD-dependent desaturase [Roseateles sp. YR242]